MKYFAIIGDMVQSRKLDDRAAVQKKLIEEIESTNQRHKQSIVSPYSVTLGDEFQALYHSPRYLLTDLVFLYLSLERSVKVRFGVGYGEIATEINRKLALGMDGDAFYRARDAIEDAKKQKRSCVAFFGSCRCYASLVQSAIGAIVSQLEGSKGIGPEIIMLRLAGVSAAECREAMTKKYSKSVSVQ